MNADKLVSNLERMLSRFEKEEISKTLAALQRSNEYGDLTLADLERMNSKVELVRTHIEWHQWIDVTHAYFKNTCAEIESSFVDSRQCDYKPSPKESTFDNNMKDPQIEFAGFLFKFVA